MLMGKWLMSYFSRKFPTVTRSSEVIWNVNEANQAYKQQFLSPDLERCKFSHKCFIDGEAERTSLYRNQGKRQRELGREGKQEEGNRSQTSMNLEAQRRVSLCLMLFGVLTLHEPPT